MYQLLCWNGKFLTIEEKILIRIELLSTKNFKEDSLDNYQRTQDVKKVYRKNSGEYILVD